MPKNLTEKFTFSSCAAPNNSREQDEVRRISGQAAEQLRETLTHKRLGMVESRKELRNYSFPRSCRCAIQAFFQNILVSGCVLHNDPQQTKSGSQSRLGQFLHVGIVESKEVEVGDHSRLVEQVAFGALAPECQNLRHLLVHLNNKVL